MARFLKSPFNLHEVPRLSLSIMLGTILLSGIWTRAEHPTAVFIIAGQSNMLNWHADANLLPTNRLDAKIPFFHASGAPPLQPGFVVTTNASSGGKWVTLGPQQQEPFVKYQRDFFGPEITFARRLASTGVAPIALIKIGYFGTSLFEDWAPRQTHGNQLYNTLIDQIRQAIKQLDGPTNIAGLGWVQGETDAADASHASAYADNLTNFLVALRSDLNAPELPIVLARIGPPPGGKYTWQETVRDAQVEVTTRLQAVTCVDTDDLARDSDNIHLLSSGVISLGTRMADAWLKIAIHSPTSPTP